VKETQGRDTVESQYGPLGLRTRLKTSRGHVLDIERNAGGDVLALRAGGGAPVSGSDKGAGPGAAKKEASSSAWEAKFTRNQLGLEMERHLPGGVRSRWERDKLGRPLSHEVWAGGRRLLGKSYAWESNDRLKSIIDALRGPLSFSHDGLGNLVSGPRGVTHYEYDAEGNLSKKTLPGGRVWLYHWDAFGMLARVVRPDGNEVTFGYDALGRRVWKKYQGKLTRWVWDGNVPIHEWVEHASFVPPKEAPVPERVQAAREAASRQRANSLSPRDAQGPPPVPAQPGTPDSPITWVFEPESFTPAARLAGGQRCSIVSDYLGTPAAMVDAFGRTLWSADIGIYGELRNLVGDRQACPFRWPGQYEDEETGLYYNRFRYYDAEAGEYVSQDPSGIIGGRAIYAYPLDPLAWLDIFGLSVENGVGRDHVTYHGIKNGKPYTGYASAPSSLGLTPKEIISRRYNGDLSAFRRAPDIKYAGQGRQGKEIARGLEQHYYEKDVKKYGKKGVANAQRPVGPHNRKRAKYRKAAKKHVGCK